MGLSLEVLEKKIANGYKLSVQEQYFMQKLTDERGVPSRRKWTGWKEFPDSEMDFPDDHPARA